MGESERRTDNTTGGEGNQVVIGSISTPIVELQPLLTVLCINEFLFPYSAITHTLNLLKRYSRTDFNWNKRYRRDKLGQLYSSQQEAYKVKVNQIRSYRFGFPGWR